MSEPSAAAVRATVERGEHDASSREWFFTLFPSDYLYIGDETVQVTPQEYPDGVDVHVTFFRRAQREAVPPNRERSA